MAVPRAHLRALRALHARLDRKEIDIIDVITSPNYRLEGAKLKLVLQPASELPKRY